MTGGSAAGTAQQRWARFRHDEVEAGGCKLAKDLAQIGVRAAGEAPTQQLLQQGNRRCLSDTGQVCG
jgi:hypothetical protein